MRILGRDKNLVRAIRSDRRISQSQREFIRECARQDPNAEVIGMDAQVRPVVRAQLGGATEASEFALFRNGAATAVSHNGNGTLLERWE